MTTLSYLWLVPALPLLGGALMFLFGRTLDPDTKRPARLPGLLCSALVIASFCIAAACAVALLHTPGQRFELHGAPWFSGAEWGLLLDPLSSLLMLLVAGIGSLVHIYSTVYMRRDGGQYRFFGGLNFFVATMQVLVLANNFLLMFAAWEGVGFASYLLIGFDYHRWRAGVAGMKAFIINRSADAGLLLALFFFLARAGSLQFSAVATSAAHWPAAQLTLAAGLLLIGAVGKSAQLPIHIWLPDAMEGPTPVSALIHSATMVCAGVYLIARCDFIFLHAPIISALIVVIGTLSALFGATVSLVENDIKRVLAYSTISQIGFMFLALGVGAFHAALFHLFTHAFFKSLLFLGAGSLIHALHGEQNLKHMGGLRREMPATHAVMWVAAMALSAIPGFAGYFSKDAVLGATLHIPNGWLIVAVGLFTSLLTACYAWRLMFLAFYGTPHAQRDPVHESPLAMTLPMWILAIGCVVAGWVFEPIHWSAWPLMIISAAVSAAGLAIAWQFYIHRPGRREGLDERFSWLARLLRNRWYIDALYEEKLVKGVVLRTASAAAWSDACIIDGGVNGAAWSTCAVSRLSRWTDRVLIDGAVRLSSSAVGFLSAPARAIQTGFVQTYALLFVAGLFAALGYYLLR